MGEEYCGLSTDNYADRIVIAPTNDILTCSSKLFQESCNSGLITGLSEVCGFGCKIRRTNSKSLYIMLTISMMGLVSVAVGKTKCAPQIAVASWMVSLVSLVVVAIVDCDDGAILLSEPCAVTVLVGDDNLI
uniref:Uncharacterized protein n=1 Tax=Glossina austeni TaxID=7395 RepID=A0A1A9UYJ8_GLOAU